MTAQCSKRDTDVLQCGCAGSVLHDVLYGPPARAHTLVTYVFSGTDPEYEHNLRYFIRTAIKVELLEEH